MCQPEMADKALRPKAGETLVETFLAPSPEFF
jgi:hypothetical protein